MGVKIGSTCLHLIQPLIPHSPSSCSQTLSSAISSSRCSTRTRRRSISIKGGALICRYVNRLNRSALFGTQLGKIERSQSCDKSNLRTRSIRRASSACLDSFSDEEFSKEIQELALRFQLSDDEEEESSSTENAQSGVIDESFETPGSCNIMSSDSDMMFLENQRPFDPLEPPDWAERDEIIPVSIERKANRVDLPLSLRIIKRKKQWQDGFRETRESAYCSVKKAFSNMVFIIREIQSYTLHMREMLFYEDLQGILVRVQKEMHASFVWLFQQVFSHTPTLMVYVMILLANYSVYSMSSSIAIAATPPPQAYASTSEAVSFVEESRTTHKFDSSAIKMFSVSSSIGKTTSIGGGNGGSGKDRPVASDADGDGSLSSNYEGNIVPGGVSSVRNPTRTGEEESVSGQVTMEEELRLWNSIVDEASRMQGEVRGDLDHETMLAFVSPIDAKIEADDYAEYFKMELLYQTGLAQEPKNPLLLANYAQFLYLVAQDYDRAEDYFKRASEVEPKDAEALSKYATFLWRVRKDMWAAEQTYVEAISAEPSNSYYAANYANFLWNTGGEDTCFPLDSPETDTDI